MRHLHVIEVSNWNRMFLKSVTGTACYSLVCPHSLQKHQSYIKDHKLVKVYCYHIK